MKDRITKFKHIKPLSYTIFFFIAFVVFLFITFPGELIKKRIIAEIENNTPFKVDIDKAGISPLLSLEMEGVKLYKSKDRYIELNSLIIRPSILALVLASPKFLFKAELLNGEIEGSLSIIKAETRIKNIEATVKHLNIDSIPSLLLSGDGSDQLALDGVMDGTINIQLAPEPKGDFQIEINHLNVKYIKVKGIGFPSFTGLKSVLKGNIDGKRTNIEEWNVTGNGIDLEISGNAPLLWELPKGGVIDLGYRLQMKGTQMAKYKGLLAPYLLTQNDGSLGGKILGTVNNPRFEKGSTSTF
ncbi:MAG: type II secretion system protein GspN [Thermodesulfobacteriota bacterium]